MTLTNLQEHPHEWHRRGMRHPAEIDALVYTRTNDSAAAAPRYRRPLAQEHAQTELPGTYTRSRAVIEDWSTLAKGLA